ncbi:hypothetical protein EDC44_10992 [Cricetibacter osteomyelitidis]|uniref:VOC family protein n=1 Tax=Cricetibacter osteomyelitidis TaxID=1521931 RepID=A0A4R2SY18_9PAST|nr:VOC family protein [Cricetibacter osteomyelitidis]TCP95397.1 hypothetical protein EDC44_10992 [Cricetibacter osteomyelitidis]
MTNSQQNHQIFQKSTALSALSWADFVAFERKILQLAEQIGLNLAELTVDHLALRANTPEQAEQWADLLTKCGKILSQNRVNGRPIYLFELNTPLLFAEQKVGVIELPFPKGKIYPQEGWEHIEVVMPFLIKESTNEWYSRLKNQFSLNQSTTFKVKVSEPKVEGEQLPNPSIAVSLVNNQQNHCCIKIHPFHIKNIIEV